jgi:RHS repeat-associated protein
MGVRRIVVFVLSISLLGAGLGVVAVALVGPVQQAEASPGTSAYANAVAAMDPITYWRLGSSSGPDPNELPGEPGFYRVGLAGVHPGAQGALRGDADTAYDSGGVTWTTPALSYPTVNAPNGAPLSLTGFVRFATPVTSTFMGPLFYVFSCGSAWSLRTEVDASGRIQAHSYLGLNTPPSYHVDASGPEIDDGQWHFIAATSGDGMLKLYVDGDEVGSGSFVSSPAQSPKQCDDGYSPGFGGGGLAEIDEFAVFDRVLPVGDVLTQYLKAGYRVPIGVLQKLGGFNPNMTCIDCMLKALGVEQPIDASTGNFYHSFSDVSVPGRGVPLAFGRTYNSDLASSSGALGHGWTTSWSQHLVIGSDTVAIVADSGAQASWYRNASGGWSPDPYVTSSLSYDAGTDTWTVEQDLQSTLVFRGDGALTSITDVHGYTTTISYPSSTSTQFSTITESTDVSGTPGRSLAFIWSGSYLASVTDPLGNKVSFDVNTTTGDLDSVTDARGGVERFTYDASHRLLTMQSPAMAAAHPTAPTVGAVTNAYDSNGDVTDQWSATATSGVAGVDTDPTHFDRSTPGQTTITDPVGDVSVYVYDDLGFLTSVTRGAGTSDAGTWSYTWDPFTAGIATVEDPTGHVTTTTWYSNCLGVSDCAPFRIKSVDNGIDPPTDYTYDSVSGLVLTVTAPYGPSATYRNTTTYTYDDHVDLASVSTPLLDAATPPATVGTRTTEFHHGDASHPEDVTSMVDPRGKTWSFAYDAYGNQTSATSPTNDLSTSAFDAGSRPVWSVQPEGNKSGGTPSRFRSAVVLDPGGLPVASLGSGTYPVVDSFDRANGAIGTAQTGQAWSATTGSFVVDGGAAKLSSASGTANLATQAVGSGDMTVGFTSTVAQADVGVAFRVSDATHYWAVTAQPGTSSWSLVLRNGTSTTTTPISGGCCSAGQHVVVRAVGPDIQVFVDGIKRGSASNSTLSTATGAGLFVAATGSGRIDGFFAGRAIGGITATTFDGDGNAVVAIDANGNRTGTSYDADGRPLVVTRPGGTTLVSTWNGNGQQTGYTDGGGNTTTYAYDHQGRPKTEQRPASNATSYGYAYGTGSETDTVTKPDGTTITTTLDALGRPSAVNYSDPATADVSIGYDHGGHRMSVATSGSTAAWIYDSLGRVTSSTRAGRTVSYGYGDLGAAATAVTYPGKSTPVQRGFDDSGRLHTVTDFDGRLATFEYDRNGNQTSTAFGPSGAPVNTDVYGYDDSNQMTSVQWRQGSSSGTVLGSEAYTRPATAVGMVTAIAPTGTAGSTTTNVGYSALDQVTSYTGKTTATYDAADDLTKTHSGAFQVFDTAQRLCWTSATATSGTCGGTKPADATTYGYDLNGNRTSKTPASSAPSAYGYDQANRLTSATVPSSLGGDGQMVTFAPSRILDTASGSGACSPSPCARLSSSTTTTVTVAGQGSVPSSDVDAVWATITVINPTAAGYVKVNQGSGAAAAVTLNFDASATRNETAIIPLTSGAITLTSTTGVDVIIDVTGYFKHSGSTGDTYHSSSPTRMVDTRNGTGTCDGSPCSTPAANHTTLVTAAGQAGLPSTGLHAVVLSITVVNTTASGQLTVAPGGSGGGAATISYTSGKTINETVIAPVDANGKISVVATTTVDWVIDVSGYFTVPTDTNLGLAYQPLTPTNLVTSSTGTGPCVGAACGALVASTRQRVQVAGQAGVPSSAGAVVGNLTLTNPAADGFARLNPTFASGMGLGGDETINFNAGKTRDTVVLVPLKSDGTIEIVSNQAAGWTLDITGYLTQPTGTWNYHYDPTGLRDAKTAPDGTVTDFTYDGEGGLPLLLEQTTGAASTYLVYGPGGQPIEQINPDGTATWLHHDQIGSVRLTTSTSTGATVGTRRFDAYGTTAAESGPAPLLGYTGQYTDNETGIQYLRARYYDPAVGQFLSSDPLVVSTVDAYGYVGRDPINEIDPSGLDYCPDGTWIQKGQHCGPGGVESNGAMGYGGNTVYTPGCDDPYGGDTGGGNSDTNGNLQNRGEPGSRNTSAGSGDDVSLPIIDVLNCLEGAGETYLFFGLVFAFLFPVDVEAAAAFTVVASASGCGLAVHGENWNTPSV